MKTTELEFLNNLRGVRNRVGIGLSYRPARLHSLSELVPWNRFLVSLKVKKFGLWCQQNNQVILPLCQLLFCLNLHGLINILRGKNRQMHPHFCIGNALPLPPPPTMKWRKYENSYTVVYMHFYV
jgi:hypothetical protein